MGVYRGQSVYNDSQVTPEDIEELIEQNGKGVFFVDYGQTTYQDALSAYNDGKILFCRFSGLNLPLYYTGNNVFTFVIIQASSNDKLQLNLTNNGWEQPQTQKIVTVDNALNATSQNPVENRAIYDVVGDVESLLAAL